MGRMQHCRTSEVWRVARGAGLTPIERPTRTTPLAMGSVGRENGERPAADWQSFPLRGKDFQGAAATWALVPWGGNRGIGQEAGTAT